MTLYQRREFFDTSDAVRLNIYYEHWVFGGLQGANILKLFIQMMVYGMAQK
jgi:hypothetical protein